MSEEKLEQDQEAPACEKCGEPKVEDAESKEYVCPSCDLKIDFFGDEEEAESE